MKLRLYHHHDGARIAYREVGAGPGLGLLHSGAMTYREWEPVVERLAERFRLVMPDLPLHGDSEDRPRHPYTPEWLVDVIAGFCRETLGPHPRLAGHGAGAELLLWAVAAGRLAPSRLVLMPNRLHRPPEHPVGLALWRGACRPAGLPGLDRAFAHGAALAFRPRLADRLSLQANPAARDLVRHAFDDVRGNGNRARSWSKLARRWPRRGQPQLLDAYARIDAPVLLLWASDDSVHPLRGAQEALERLPDGQLRVLADTGFLMTYDDPVGVGRELAAFCA